MVCTGKPETSPLATESTFSGVSDRGKEVKGVPHLSCSHVHPFLYRGSLSESTKSICKGFCIKSQKLKLEQNRINFEGTLYIHLFDYRERNESFDSKQGFKLFYWKFYRSMVDTFIKVLKWENNLMET